jgi:hypothetical protein
VTIRNMKDSAIPFGAHSRPMLIRDQCQLAAARLRCKPRSHAVDGLARSDATDRSPLHSGAKPETQGGSRRYRARYEARYTVAHGGTRHHVQVCCQAVCGAEANHPCGRSQTSRGGGLRWQVPQAVRTLEPARGWWQRTPRVAVPAYRPLSQAWHHAHHTEVLMRSTAPQIFQPRKNSKIDAHTCPEGGDASKPGPTHGATAIEPRAPGGQAVQKYRRRAARTDRARSRVGRGYAALAAMPLGPPDVPRPWHGTGVGKVLREKGFFVFFSRITFVFFEVLSARGWSKTIPRESRCPSLSSTTSATPLGGHPPHGTSALNTQLTTGYSDACAKRSSRVLRADTLFPIFG